MEEVYLGLTMLLIAVLCFISSDYLNANGFIGLRGISYIFFRNVKKRYLAFKITNRVFGPLLFVGSVIYAIVAFAIYRNNYIDFHGMYRSLFFVYIVLAGVVADILAFNIIKKDI